MDISDLNKSDYIIEADSTLCTDRKSGLLELKRVTRLLLSRLNIDSYNIDFSDYALSFCRKDV